MAIAKRVETRGKNGNGCGEEAVDPVAEIFGQFGVSLAQMANEVGVDNLRKVDLTNLQVPIAAEEALAFAKILAAREMLAGMEFSLQSAPQSPLSPALSALASNAESKAKRLLDGYYPEDEIGEHQLSLWAAAIRRAISQG